MKFHEYVTSKLRAITELKAQARRKEAEIVKKLSPHDYLRKKTKKLVAGYADIVKRVFSCFDNPKNEAYADQLDAEECAAAKTGIRNALYTVTELDWFDDNRPFYNVYPIVEKLVRNTKLEIPVAQLDLPTNAICFRFPKGHEPLGIKTALIKIGNFDTAAAKSVAPLFITPTNKEGELKVFICGSFEVVDDEDRFLIQIPDKLVDELGGPTATVEDMLASSLSGWQHNAVLEEAIMGVSEKTIAADLPMYTERLYFLFRLTVLLSLVAKGNDLIMPAVLASEQDKYDAETDKEAKRWLEERAAQIQGRGFNFGKELQQRSETSPHWRNPHMALYWTGPGGSVPVLKLRQGAVVMPRHLADVPTGFDCPIVDAEAAQTQVEYVYFLRDPSQGFVKIGRTRRKIADRQKESSTFVPGGLALLAYIETGDCVELETRIHREYGHLRRHNEFFALDDTTVTAIVAKFGGVTLSTEN